MKKRNKIFIILGIIILMVVSIPAILIGLLLLDINRQYRDSFVVAPYKSEFSR